MIVRSRLPWPLRWAIAAVMLGFSAAIALWAFQFGKAIAGLDRDSQQELQSLRSELQQLRTEHAQARQVADTAESLLKAERAAQETLARQVRQLEAANMVLQADLGFFERLLPAGPGEDVAVRGLQLETQLPGQLRYQLLVMNKRQGAAEFNGRLEMTLAGTLDGKPWSSTPPGGAQPLRLRQYARIEGQLQHPVGAMVKTVQVRVTDAQGAVRTTHLARL